MGRPAIPALRPPDEPKPQIGRAVKILLEDDRIFRAILGSMAEGVVVWAAPDGAFLGCNSAAERILGVTHATLSARKSNDIAWHVVREDGTLFPPAERPVFTTLRTGEPQTGVVMGLPRSDGTCTWIRVSSVPLRSPQGLSLTGVVTTFVDVTELRGATVRAGEASRRLQQVLEGSNVGSWELDLTSGQVKRDGRWAEILGYEPEDLAPTFSALAALLHPEDVSCLAVMESSFKRGASCMFECRLKHRGGHWHWVQIRGKVVDKDAFGSVRKVSGVLVDIHTRKQTEEKLQEALVENKYLTEDLKASIQNERTLEGLLPICLLCKNLRDDAGYRARLEAFSQAYSSVTFTHDVCPECFPEYHGGEDENG